MQRALVAIILLTWIGIGCTPIPDKDGCYGYWYKTGLQRGTLKKNRKHILPYRQCVEKNIPHKNLEKRPYG